MNMQDKIAIITGGATGIGKETARMLLEGGARILSSVADIRDYPDVLFEFACVLSGYAAF